MTSVAIKRGDGFGYQLAARMITQTLCDIDGREYHHNKITIADRKHIKDQACLDFLYEQITGEKNITAQEADIHYTNWVGYVKEQHQSKRKVSPMFDRSMFSKYSGYFLKNNSKYNCFGSREKQQIVIHVRRGDLIEQDYGRCLDDSVYIDMISDLFDKHNIAPDEYDIHIETDSPDMVLQLADNLKAHVNTVSSHHTSICSHPIKNVDHNEWRVVIGMLQSLYNMASCDFFIPSRSSFSVIGGLLGDSKIVTNRIKPAWKKPVNTLYPVTREYMNLSEDVDRIKFKVYWLHYLPIVEMSSINTVDAVHKIRKN